MPDLFTVQSELAAAIASSLQASIVAPARARHVERDEQAHDSYMRARYELEEQSTPAAVLRAQAGFQRAIDRDREYAAAYAGLGSARYNLGGVRFNSKFTDRMGSEQMWRKALELDPSLEEAHCGLALLAMQYDWDWARAEREVQAALAAGPSARAELRYANILTFQGRFKEADEHLQRSQEIDPLGVNYTLTRGQMWALAKRTDKARAEIQKVLDRHPDVVQAQTTMSFLDMADGHPEPALQRMQDLAEGPPTMRVID